MTVNCYTTNRARITDTVVLARREGVEICLHSDGLSEGHITLDRAEAERLVAQIAESLGQIDWLYPAEGVQS